jgi:hypothetical protein
MNTKAQISIYTIRAKSASLRFDQQTETRSLTLISQHVYASFAQVCRVALEELVDCVLWFQILKLSNSLKMVDVQTILNVSSNQFLSLCLSWIYLTVNVSRLIVQPVISSMMLFQARILSISSKVILCYTLAYYLPFSYITPEGML